jgi:hypothetical protein
VSAIIAKNVYSGPSDILTSPGGRGVLVVDGAGPDVVLTPGAIDSTNNIPHDLNTIVLAGIPVIPGDLMEFSLQHIRTGWGPAGQQPPVARVILAALWFDGDGKWLSTNVGPAVPANNDDVTWGRSAIQMFVPTGAVYGLPAVWWKAASSWSGVWTDPTQRPTYGRYISTVMFGTVQTVAEGRATVPVAPDFLLTLGVTAKTLASQRSYLGGH